MARKSRKNMMPQAAVQEAVQQNEKELLRTAAYARLSVENGGHETEDSLHTQILQIHNYIRENPELTLTDTYADNGFTGTRFDRPEFERMMQDVRTGKIQCIVVKDLSRFGRDYIETGSYLETIFPMLHVRFIAINDDFDNIRQSDVDSLAVPIKNMVNSLYAKDISKKISLSYQMRREKGIPTSWCTPYGYRLNQQGNKLEATEDAKWVKLIYQWYLAGVSTNEIARRLEFLEVARPNERLNRKLHEGDDPTYNKWHPSTVLRILNSSAYIGELVSGKTQTASYKGIGLHPVEKREWHIVENAHEAIILKSDFEKVQARREQNKEKRERAMARSKATREKCYNHLSGMVYCGCCRRNMTFERRVHAPSVGKTAADECVPEYVIRGIKKFKKISARDDLTEQLVCNITGTAPERVLDPTFLAEFPRAELAAKKKPYILFYYCENLPHNILNQIFSYAKEHGLAVYGAGECDKRYSEITVNLMPFEWVEMFRNAEFVFTGTFHGAVFSILNRRQFKVYLTNESRIKKVTALLEELGIQNRKMDSKFEFDLESMKNEINYDAVYRVINEKRQSSKQYLKDAIGMAKQ